MSWYKKTQQQMLFYPWGGNPSKATQTVSPIGVDPATQQNIYKCHICGKNILEEEAEWYKDTEGQGESLQLPKYDPKRILQALTEIASYLSPVLQKLQEYIQKENLESKRNNIYDYGFTSVLQRWETQVPQLPNILNKYPELGDICAFKSTYWGDAICKLISGNTEINGEQLNNLSSFIQQPQNFVEEFAAHSRKDFSINYTVPVCEECYEEFNVCASCQETIPPGAQKTETVYDNQEFVCEKCLENGKMDMCMECGRADDPNDMHYKEDEGSICSECYKGGNEERIEWAEKVISNLDIPVGKNYPVSEKVLNNLWGFLNRYIEKYGSNELNYKEFSKIQYLAKKANLSKESMEYLDFIGRSYKPQVDKYSFDMVGDVLQKIDNNIQAQSYMKEQYPQISNYQDLPFDIDVEKSYNEDKQGFTLTITPSKEFFDFAKGKYPNIDYVWEKMRNTPHHPGVLAYARCAYEGGDKLVVNNLQRDADYDNFTSKEYAPTGENNETAKWLDKTTKNWDVFLLNLIKAISISENISSFLTTFDQQKSKWGNLPIHKSKRTYEQIPEQMGFPLEEGHGAEELVEERGMYQNPMYQIANDYINWYKKAQEDIELSKNNSFDSWFSGSKVIDAEGKPLKVYHGTNINFDKFNLDFAAQGIIWFSSNKNTILSGESGASGTSFIKEAYLSIKNPAEWPEYEKYGIGELKNLGYDGIILDDDYVVFNPSQIKIII